MITVYKVKGDATKPIPVQCEVFKYPHADSDCDTIYVNTHFATEGEAWDKLIAEFAAGLGLAARQQSQLESQFAEAVRQTAEAGCLLAEAQENHRRWVEEQKEATSNG